MRFRMPSLALVPVVLLASVPFLLPHHRDPIPTFFQEWWAIVFGLLAASALLVERYRAAWSLPRVALLPITIGALILLQLAFGIGGKRDGALIGLLYLGWAALLMSAIRSQCQILGEAAVGRALAIGLVIAGLVSSGIVAVQFVGSVKASGFISAPVGNRLFANLNQPNHLALLLWLAIAALAHLRSRRDVGAGTAAVGVAILALASILTGSRAVAAYAAAVVVLAVWQHRRRGELASALPLAIIALAFTIAGQSIIELIAAAPTSQTLAQREWGKDSHGIRAGLWWMAWKTGVDAPLLGIGWGRFSPHTFGQLAEYRAIAPHLPLVPAEHAHNIFMQLFAELGAAAPILVVGFGLAWMRAVARRTPSAQQHLVLSVVCLLVLHAQVEYTLWYAHFLGVAAVALALADPTRLKAPVPGRLAVIAILAASFATAGLLRSDYVRLEETMRWPATEDGTPPRPWQDVSAELLELKHRSRFGAYVDLVLVGVMPLERDHLAHKLALCRSAIAFSPTDYAVFKCAGLLALDGQRAEALDLLERAMLAYPEKVAEFVRDGAIFAKTHAELAPLVDSARRFAAERRLL
jgi:O-antigen ligase